MVLIEFPHSVWQPGWEARNCRLGTAIHFQRGRKEMFFAKAEKIQISIENFFNSTSAAIVGFMMCLTTVDVILRYVFNSPIPGVYTLCEMLMVGIVYLAIAYVQQKKGHVRVDVFIDRLEGPPRCALGCLGNGRL